MSVSIYIGEKEYYERQFATLKSFEEVDTVVESDECIDDEEDKEQQAQQERAMKISNYANIALLILKVRFILYDRYFISFHVSDQFQVPLVMLCI